MFGAMAVKHMAMLANMRPPTKDKKITNGNKVLEIKPKAATTANTMVEFMVARVAPHTISPAITSSTLTGVAIMASKVFWKYIRTNDAKVPPNKQPSLNQE